MKATKKRKVETQAETLRRIAYNLEKIVHLLRVDSTNRHSITFDYFRDSTLYRPAGEPLPLPPKLIDK
jgi:hypothetical protein